MLDLLFKLACASGLILGLAWNLVSWTIAYQYKANPEYKAARSKVAFIKAQPRTPLSLFAIYRYLKLAIYGLLIFAVVILLQEFALRFAGYR
jgi:hypothetical protein